MLDWQQGETKLSWLKSGKRYLIIIIVIIALIALSQFERFIHSGTLLGYKIRDVTSEQDLARQNSSGMLINGKIVAHNQPSLACDFYPHDKVSKIIGQDIKRIAGFVPDQTNPIISTCNYSVNKKNNTGIQSVAILVRDLKDANSAKKTFNNIKLSSQTNNIESLGDQALFNPSSNQLTVRTDKRLTTITVPKTATSRLDNKTVAINIIKIKL